MLIGTKNLDMIEELRIQQKLALHSKLTLQEVIKQWDVLKDTIQVEIIRKQQQEKEDAIQDYVNRRFEDYEVTEDTTFEELKEATIQFIKDYDEQG